MLIARLSLAIWLISFDLTSFALLTIAFMGQQAGCGGGFRLSRFDFPLRGGQSWLRRITRVVFFLNI
jgi:hypothetical protein